MAEPLADVDGVDPEETWHQARPEVLSESMDVCRRLESLVVDEDLSLRQSIVESPAQQFTPSRNETSNSTVLYMEGNPWLNAERQET